MERKMDRDEKSVFIRQTSKLIHRFFERRACQAREKKTESDEKEERTGVTLYTGRGRSGQRELSVREGQADKGTGRMPWH